MLEHVNHPFICNLRYSFQDIEYMYARLVVAPEPRHTFRGHSGINFLLGISLSTS